MSNAVFDQALPTSLIEEKFSVEFRVSFVEDFPMQVVHA